ncbi:hypothetical protein ACFL43_05500 [Thermodesulfobacteriota bacterium]
MMGSILRRCTIRISVCVVAVALAALQAQAASLDLGSALASPGESVTLPLTLSGSDGIVSLSTDISIKSGILGNPTVALSPAALAAGKEIFYNVLSRGVLRIGILGYNLNDIPEGLVAEVTFDLKSGICLRKNIPLKNRPGAADAEGRPVAITGESGTIRIIPALLAE